MNDHIFNRTRRPWLVRRRTCYRQVECGGLPSFMADMVVAFALLGAWSMTVQAADPENCLSCHRYRGLSRITDDGQRIGLYYVDPNYYDHSLGPHCRLRCTDCHEREAVSVIPHKPVQPVDCTSRCHLADRANVAVRFSHGGIQQMLDGSVHNSHVLEASNTLLGSPLRKDQSRCLLCHDEPIFRQIHHNWAGRPAPTARCAVCHTEQLPVNASYAYWHVASRSRPARSHKNVARSCAICHSDPEVRKAFKMPDVTASYLASFHGKAMLLDNEQTAGCLDCHTGELQNVHICMKKTDPESPTHVTRLPDTCRSVACHPTAGAKMSTAAVHLEMSRTRGIEYFIGAMFILLIITTYGSSLLIQILELLQMIVGRSDPLHHERAHQAEQLMANPAGASALRRFTPHQRVQHWLLMICFTALVLTGFPIKFADRSWAQWLVEMVGGLHFARLIHRYIGLILILGLIYHLVYVAMFVWRQKRLTGRSWFKVILDLPMVMNAKDLRQLFHLLAYLCFLERTRPQGDRFSLKEKFEYFGVFWGTVLLGITGVLMWANAWTTEHFTGRVLTIAMIVHTFEAFLALLHVGIIHMIGVIFSPTVFPMSPAMFTGNTPIEELVEAHAGMLTDVNRRIGTAGGTSHD